MKEIRTNLYKIENKKNLSTQKVITFKISVNRGGSYIDSPKWIKNNNKKKTIKNPEKIMMINAFNMF